jgi:hypothetical protein
MGYFTIARQTDLYKGRGKELYSTYDSACEEYLEQEADRYPG